MAGAKRFHAWAFRRLYQYVEYKAEMIGIEVEQVSPAYTSQRCSSCGFTHETNRQSKHQFVCQKCEYELNADYNASKNIGHKLLKTPPLGAEVFERRRTLSVCAEVRDIEPEW